MMIQKSFADSDQGRLFLVPTPIGNLADMTFRALEVLKSVQLIACEDTRRSIKLLNHFNIECPLISYHEHNKESRIAELIQELKEGHDIALVSDAGTPVISDPGFELVQACIASSISVIPLTGANAAITALIASGIQAQAFTFYGFLSSQKNLRRQALDELKAEKTTLIFYESPHRLKKMLKDSCSILGGERSAVICRELSKQYEEIVRGTLEELEQWASEQELRGEFCIVVEGLASDQPKAIEKQDFISYADHVRLLVEQQSLSPKEAIKEVAKLHGVAKRFVYNEYHDL